MLTTATIIGLAGDSITLALDIGKIPKLYSPADTAVQISIPDNDTSATFFPRENLASPHSRVLERSSATA